MSSSTRSHRRGRRVAIFGGGPGGLTVAHELAERGFEIDLYERHSQLGGKTRSFNIPDTGTGGRRDLPAELGPHGMLGGYRNIGETLSKIPTENGGCVADDFEPVPFQMAWSGRETNMPLDSLQMMLSGMSAGLGPGILMGAMAGLFGSFGNALGDKLTPADFSILVTKVLALLTSGPKRALGQLEHMSLTEFLGADRLSADAMELVVLWMQLATQPPELMNARVATRTLHSYLGGLMNGPGTGLNAAVASLPTGPLNEVWFEPWRAHLSSMGAKIHTRTTLTGLAYERGRITGASLHDDVGSEFSVDADYYVLALPADKVPAILTPELISAEPALGRIQHLGQTWLGAEQIYLKTKLDIPPFGATMSPWALAWANPNVGHWSCDFQAEYGDGTVASHLSIDMARWDRTGMLYGKPARECTAAERFEEIRAQLRSHTGNDTLLADEDIHSVSINPAMSMGDDGIVINDEPVFASTPSCWENQPEPVTSISNLFLAAGYVRSGIGLDSTEAANEAGKRAANGILAAAEESAASVVINEIPAGRLAFAWDEDDRRYEAGQANAFDLFTQ